MSERPIRAVGARTLVVLCLTGWVACAPHSTDRDEGAEPSPGSAVGATATVDPSDPPANLDPLAPPPMESSEPWPDSYRDFPRRPQGEVTWSREIAPLVFEHCTPCHRAGGGAPFPLTDLEEARRRATEIATVTKMRFMPPWLPDHVHGGPFLGERGLTVEQVGLFQQWVFEGMPEGDPNDLPPTPDWPDGWTYGEPDLVIRLPEPFVLPAGGSDVYRTFVIPAPVTRERWVRGYEFRAENPAVVHHATIEVDPTDSARVLDAEDPEPGFGGMRAEGAHMPDGHFVGWVPGRRPTMLPEGMAWSLTSRTDLVIQLHMLPSGRPEPVQIELALYFADEAPVDIPMMVRLGKRMLDIPAGEDAYPISDAYRLPVDVDVTSVFPHAHYLAEEMEGFATRPDGSKLWLVRIEDWDFNWQDEYRFATPKSLPEGSILGMRFVYDNSASNIQNPHDPPVRVKFGPSTFDEMGDLWIQVMPKDRADRGRLLAHYQLFDRNRTVERCRVRVEREPESAPFRNELAHHLMLAGRLDEAIAEFREAIRLDPDYVHGRRNLAIALFNARELDESAEQFRWVLERRPDDAASQANLGRALAMSGRLDEAVDALERAVALVPENVGTRFQLAWSLDKLGRERDALEQYLEAAARDQKSPRPQVASAWLTATRPALIDSAVAVEHAERAASLTGGTDPVALETLAAAYAAAGRFDEASAVAERALRILSLGGFADRVPRVREALQGYRTGIPYVSKPGETAL